MRDFQECFYCGGLVSSSRPWLVRGDHFPVPECAGGVDTVPCCESCHDMKDRFTLDQWPMEWIEKIIEDFPKLNRETRLFIAKMLKVAAVEHTPPLKAKTP